MKTKAVFVLLLLFVSCISGKFVIKNIDNNAPVPKLSKDGFFQISQYSNDPKYGYQKEFPINIFYQNTKNDTLNQYRFLKGLSGPNGEKISFKKLESCCPFTTKHGEIGAGFLDVYEITWSGLKTPKKLYINIYEKGVLMIPAGFSISSSQK